MEKNNLDPKKLFFDLDYNELIAEVLKFGEPPYRAHQIWQGIYRNLKSGFSELSNIPVSLREELTGRFRLSSLENTQTITSRDGNTQKTLFLLSDGNTIESVLMSYNSRRTICISTQVGCALGCVFCATGQMGYKKNLSCGEIVEQVVYYARQLNSFGEKVTNIVYMGMGEPFLNYEAVTNAIDNLNVPFGMNLGERRFTISTVGIIPAIYRFLEEKRQVNLAISLHAADNMLRSSLLPINKKYALEDLIAACKDYVKATGRRITFEWALIDGINDTSDQATKLIRLLKDLLCHVNIISLNPTRKFNRQGADRMSAENFRAYLEAGGIPCTIRLKRGADIQAGCGQLASKVQPPFVML
jgi:23S rRNA (adenine2503-C2)-methyltransferase